LRLNGRLEYAEGSRDVWFEIPDELEPELSRSGAPWLLTMLPVAAKTGEAIDLSLPVDPFFLENIRGLVGTWKHWYPELHTFDIRVPTERSPAAASRVAQFFSGGVDSWFTLLRHCESTPTFEQVGDVHDLITVWGFDIAIERPEEFTQLSDSAAAIAERYGKKHIVIATNLRERMDGAWKSAWGPDWGPLSHGAALAAVGLLLEPRDSRILIASTHRFWEPFPYGSHPLTDTLFSTSATQFAHDHALYSRTDKTERIAQSDFAMSKLKVCYAEGAFKNCSRCVKCHRMLLSFDILGILDKATSFDLDVYRRNRHRKVLVWNENDLVRLLEVRDLALRHNRPEIASLMEESVRQSRRVKAITQRTPKLSWRLWNAVYRSVAGDMIGA